MSASQYDDWDTHSCYHMCKVSIDPCIMAIYINIRLSLHSPLPYMFHAFRKNVLPLYWQICISTTATGL
jgi:hypothetical protein